MFEVPVEINSLLKGFPALWGVAGGWAIDLFLDKETRPHHDIEVTILRRAQLEMKSFLSDWNFEYVHRGVVSDWTRKIYLDRPIHEIYAIKEGDSTAKLEILLNEHAGKNWLFRRNMGIKLPIEEIFVETASGIPILHPKIVLLYKVKRNESKDLEDLVNAAPILTKPDRAWLYNAIWSTYGRHEWLRYLS